LKERIWISDFNSWIKIRDYKPILLDANVLMSIARSVEQFPAVSQLIRNWKNMRTTSAAFIADFIRLEALNAERWSRETSCVRRFLKEVEESKEGFYVEMRTPIKEVVADSRSRYLDLLPKRDRRILMQGYPQLSGTDISLLIMAIFMRNAGSRVHLASIDKELIGAAKALGVSTLEDLCF
jgi:hypothetical protein